MPRRPAPSPLAAALLATIATLAACADPVAAPTAVPIAAPEARPVAEPAPATALLDFDASTARYWSGFNFLFDAGGAPLSGGWPDHAPQAWRPTDFDVARHSRDPQTWFEPQPFRAMHGTNCAPYQNAEPANDVRPGDTGSHAVTTYADMNFRCRNHMMTTLKSSGYAVIYLTPNALVSFGSGTATIRFALATLRTSGNDWIDLWITPWDDNLALPLDGSLTGTDLGGAPRTGVHVRMVPGSRERSAFEAYTISNHRETRVGGDPRGYESFLTPTSTFRDTFELQISRSRLRFGITARTAGAQTHPAFTWVDAQINLPGHFTSGVLQFGHHSMSQTLSDNGGVGGTWHWDDFRITPAAPFSIIRPVPDATGQPIRSVDPRNGATPIRFQRDAPAGSFLRFAAIGLNMQVSFDGGETWRDASMQESAVDRPDRFRSYWTPVPRNASAPTRVLFRSVLREDDDRPLLGPYLVQDLAIWSRS